MKKERDSVPEALLPGVWSEGRLYPFPYPHPLRLIPKLSCDRQQRYWVWLCDRPKRMAEMECPRAQGIWEGGQGAFVHTCGLRLDAYHRGSQTVPWSPPLPIHGRYGNPPPLTAFRRRKCRGDGQYPDSMDIAIRPTLGWPEVPRTPLPSHDAHYLSYRIILDTMSRRY